MGLATIDASIGGIASNSYIALADAELFFDLRLYKLENFENIESINKKFKEDKEAAHQENRRTEFKMAKIRC